MRSDIGAQQFIARVVAEHAHHGVVDVQKPAIRRREKQAFLNAVKQFAVAPLRFAAVGNVLQNVNGARIIIGDARRARGRYQKDPLRGGHHIFFARLLRVPAKRAWQVAAAFRDLPQAAHGFAHQRYRRHTQVRGQRAVRPDHAPGAVMHHDVIANGVDIFHPLALGAFQLGKSPEIFQRQRRVTR